MVYIKNFFGKFCISDNAVHRYYDEINELYSQYDAKTLHKEYVVSKVCNSGITILSAALGIIITVLAAENIMEGEYRICSMGGLLSAELFVFCMIVSGVNRAKIKECIAEKYLNKSLL